ncbi:hypothetical protein Cob_v005911 [Colletotrichum orbiculare MAFF 240422]|uniref:Uncharacterized protein n=1 Tax=Colletotrichum orbiculare (strain 104-T / ATCC 96160 / CBS 514.97 / LARS 414 / MAFF 240422) TaxID=1213857 RepID=N4VHW2_COLOR|nr:hypothetical protein Cob_v005911 [Colletotrichum orbiculare MAFF 240422]
MNFILDSRVPKGGGSSGGRGSSGKSKSKSKSKSKGGSSSSSKSKSKGPHVAAAGAGHKGGNNGFNQLPVWARVLIIVLIIWSILFLVSLAYYITKELKRKTQGQKFRFGHVVGNALLVSTGLWLPVYLYKKLAARRREKGAGTYAKIEEGQAAGGAAKESNRDSWYAGAAGVSSAEQKYEPMGTPPPYRAAASPAPHASSGPSTGAAAGYYVTPPSQTAPTQHPPQYG